MEAVKRRITFALALAVLVTVPGLAQADHANHERVVRHVYDLAPPGPFASTSLSPAGQVVNVGGTNVSLEQGEHRVEVFMLDDTTRQVPGRIAFFDEAGELLAMEDFCFELEREIPNGTQDISIHPSTVFTPCVVDGLNHGPAVRGEILVVLS